MAAPEGGPPGLAPQEPEIGPDGEIIGGPRTPQQIAAQKRLQQSRAQVDEVVDIMKTNVEKVLDRDAKLSELDDRAEALQHGASQFEQQAKSLKNKFWLQNLKMMIIMGVIGLIIIGLLFVRYRGTPTMGNGTPPAPTNSTLPAITKH
ncbi:neuronal synaptobrevin-like isoform X1 [Achroia grisella]|uniref:neuronal synaptobrevin-like isoform X1 n=1 Tax=Achroia grisella TaxID=688607 RepID=UPI0027D27BB7|nr:neuronal synaptobrevin-like isoform X1 [Achroia grisella]